MSHDDFLPIIVMFAAGLITLRETLEASLVVGIVLAYLDRSGRRQFNRFVWLGVAGGIAVSVLLAFVFEWIFGGLEGKAEELYEGGTMLLAAGLLTWMIIWMLRQRRTMRSSIEQETAEHVSNEYPLGILFLTLVSTAREGIETVIFMKALIVHSDAGLQLLGGAAGILFAIGISYFLFRGLELLPLSRIFSSTSVLLILFAAGLVAHGVHEFQEAGILPFLTATIWDLNPPALADGSYPLFHESGAIGSILKGVFGYNGDPTILEVLSYVTYLIAAFFGWKRMTREA